MADLKLPRLPDRTPVKMTITISPALAEDLAAYAQAYRQQYGREEPIAELVPAMLARFLESDRAFVRARRAAASP